MKSTLKKTEKGITLVALVVTIVVLLILAGVSINTVVGDDGIIQKAKEKAEATKRASAEEEMNRLVLEYQLAKNDETLESFLQEKVTEGRIDGVTDNGDGTVTISKRVDGKDYTITVKKPAAPTPSVKVGAIRVVSDSTGAGSSLGEASTRKGTTLYIMIESTISGGTTTVSPQVPYAVTENGTYKFTVTGTVNGTTYTKEVSVEVNQFKKSILEDIKIGDYVNYTPKTEKSESTVNQNESGTSEQKVAKDATLKWQILNIDEANGRVDLVSADTTSSTVEFYGALGYHNGPYIMNKICEELYSNSELNVKARNINLLDMEKHLTAEGITERNRQTHEVQYGKTKTYRDNYSYYPLLYDGQKGAGVNVAEADASKKIAKTDITKGNDPYGESVETTNPLTDKTYKKADKSVLTVTQTYYSISIKDNYGDAGSVLSNSKWYWVAARYVNTQSYGASFGLRCAYTSTGGTDKFSSHNRSGTNGSFGLRPVVSLSSSILGETKDANGAWNLK